MVELRTQDDDPEPQWFSRYREATEQRFSRWEKAYDQWISRLEDMAADLLCRSRKKENPEDQICNDEELTEIEAETKSSGIEDRAVENEANSDVISASVKKEQIPQIQVPTSQLEPSLRFHNASPDVCEDFKSLVGFDGLCDHVKARAELVTKSTSVTNNQAAHQLFDVIPLMTKVLSKEHKARFHKSWRFKFKDKAQPRELMKGKMGVHEANATRNQLSSVAVGDSQETQWLFNDELKDIRKFQIVIEEGHNSYAFQEFNGISLRSHILHQQKKPSKSPKSWKFKYKVDSEDQLSNSMVKESGIEILSDRWLSNSICCELETGEIDNDEYRVPSDSDLVVNEVEKVKKELVATEVDGETVSLIDNNQHSQEKVKNRSTNSVLQPSLVPQMCSLLKEQVHEAREENSTFEIHKNLVQQVLLEEDSTTHFHEPVSKSENLRKMKVNSLLNNREAVVAVVERSRQVCVDKSDGQLFWMVFVREPAIRAVQRIWEKEAHEVDNFEWKMQTTTFQSDILLISLQGIDMNQKGWLHGIKSGSVRDIKAEKLEKIQEDQVQLTMLSEHKDANEEQEDFCTLNALTADSGDESAVDVVWEKFPEVIAEPTELPPFRYTHNHKIQLLEGSKSVNQRYYRYAIHQKNEIDKMVADMIAGGTTQTSAGYYGRVVKGFVTIAGPLHALTKTDAFAWSGKAQSAFDELQLASCNAPVSGFQKNLEVKVLYGGDDVIQDRTYE